MEFNRLFFSQQFPKCCFFLFQVGLKQGNLKSVKKLTSSFNDLALSEFTPVLKTLHISFTWNNFSCDLKAKPCDIPC